MRTKTAVSSGKLWAQIDKCFVKKRFSGMVILFLYCLVLISPALISPSGAVSVFSGVENGHSLNYDSVLGCWCFAHKPPVWKLWYSYWHSFLLQTYLYVMFNFPRWRLSRCGFFLLVLPRMRKVLELKTGRNWFDIRLNVFKPESLAWWNLLCVCVCNGSTVIGDSWSSQGSYSEQVIQEVHPDS